MKRFLVLAIVGFVVLQPAYIFAAKKKVQAEQGEVWTAVQARIEGKIAQLPEGEAVRLQAELESILKKTDKSVRPHLKTNLGKLEREVDEVSYKHSHPQAHELKQMTLLGLDEAFEEEYGNTASSSVAWQVPSSGIPVHLTQAEAKAALDQRLGTIKQGFQKFVPQIAAVSLHLEQGIIPGGKKNNRGDFKYDTALPDRLEEANKKGKDFKQWIDQTVTEPALKSALLKEVDTLLLLQKDLPSRIKAVQNSVEPGPQSVSDDIPTEQDNKIRGLLSDLSTIYERIGKAIESQEKYEFAKKYQDTSAQETWKSSVNNALGYVHAYNGSLEKKVKEPLPTPYSPAPVLGKVIGAGAPLVGSAVVAVPTYVIAKGQMRKGKVNRAAVRQKRIGGALVGAHIRHQQAGR